MSLCLSNIFSGRPLNINETSLKKHITNKTDSSRLQNLMLLDPSCRNTILHQREQGQQIPSCVDKSNLQTEPLNCPLYSQKEGCCICMPVSLICFICWQFIITHVKIISWLNAYHNIPYFSFWVFNIKDLLHL